MLGRGRPAGTLVGVHALETVALETESGAPRERLERAIEEVGKGGGGDLVWWVSRPSAADEALAAKLGFTPGRLLYQMRRPIPVDEPHRRGAEPLQTRPFRPGVDEDGWLAVNNRAFAWHPEQGGWTRETIEAEEREDWFDPAGFLLHPADGHDTDTGKPIDGFCWTKVHPATGADPQMGEIYVIAADPAAAGGGFGRRLTLAGLDHLAAAGIGTGMLYVDATNERAVKLYVDLGFVVHHLHQGFAKKVLPGR